MDDRTDGTGSTPPDPPQMPSPPPEGVRGIPMGTPTGPSPPAGSARMGALLMLIGGIAAILGAFLPRLEISGPGGGSTTVSGFSSFGFGMVILAGFAIAKGVQGLDPSRIRMRLSAPIWTGVLMLVPLVFHWNDVHRAVDVANAAGFTASIGIGVWTELVGVLAVIAGGAILQFGNRP